MSETNTSNVFEELLRERDGLPGRDGTQGPAGPHGERGPQGKVGPTGQCVEGLPTSSGGRAPALE